MLLELYRHAKNVRDISLRNNPDMIAEHANAIPLIITQDQCIDLPSLFHIVFFESQFIHE
jgi:hypothetical protein